MAFAYLYGSCAAGKAAPLSDIDIAVCLNSCVPAKNRLDIRLRLIGEVSSLLHRDDVDMVILNDAPPLLAFRACSTGEKIFCRNELARIRFEARTMSLYYDRQMVMERSAAMMLRRVALHGLNA